MSVTDESLTDYLARLNLERKRTVWIENRAKINYVYEKTKKYIKNAKTACEVGVGEGYLLRLLHKCGLRVVGIDISKYLIKRLRDEFRKEGLDIELVEGDFSGINLEQHKFDVIFCLDVLEHIPELGKAIENIKTSLSNGGLLIGTLPLHENLDDNMVICPKCHYEFHRIGHYHSFDSIEDIEEILGEEFKMIYNGEVYTVYKEIRHNLLCTCSRIVQKVKNFISRNKNASTVYFVAELYKSDQE